MTTAEQRAPTPTGRGPQADGHLQARPSPSTMEPSLCLLPPVQAQTASRLSPSPTGAPTLRIVSSLLHSAPAAWSCPHPRTVHHYHGALTLLGASGTQVPAFLEGGLFREALQRKGPQTQLDLNLNPSPKFNPRPDSKLTSEQKGP